MRRIFSAGVAIVLVTLGVSWFGGTASASEASNSGFITAACDAPVVTGEEVIVVAVKATAGSFNPIDQSIRVEFPSGGSMQATLVAGTTGSYQLGSLTQEVPVYFTGLQASSDAELAGTITAGVSCPNSDPVIAPDARYLEWYCEDGAPSAVVLLDNSASTERVGFEVAASSGYLKQYSLKARFSKEVIVPIAAGAKTTVYASANGGDVLLVEEVVDARKCVEPTYSATPSPSNSETSSPSPTVTVTDHDMTEEPSSSSSTTATEKTPKHHASEATSAVAAPAELPKTGGNLPMGALFGVVLLGVGGAIMLVLRAAKRRPARKH